MIGKIEESLVVNNPLRPLPVNCQLGTSALDPICIEVIRRQRTRLVGFKYIENFYNRKRRHSTLGGISPVKLEHYNGLPIAA